MMPSDHNMDSDQSRRKLDLTVVPTFNDRADVNGKRFLGIFKDEKQSNGKHSSMLKVAWNFCKTRVIIASIFYTVSTLLALICPVIFLKMTLDTLENESFSFVESESVGNFTIVQSFKVVDFKFKLYGRFECLAYMLGFATCLILSKVFDAITSWLNLRTAIRLRSGVLAASYKKAIKSSILNNIAAHQILTDDIDSIMDLVNHLTKTLGTIIALILTLAASIALLNWPAAWPIFSAIGFFCIPILLAKISTNRLRKSMHYLAKKLTVVESFCVNFKDAMIHNITYEAFIKQFYGKLSMSGY
jgi:hypothetical protein